MTTPSPKLGLSLPATTDQFSTADIRSNWEKIDAAPGVHICTSTTRPSNWTAAMVGRRILETDSRLEWMWDGTQFIRLSGTGLLRRTDGSFAIGERTSNYSTTANNFTKVVSVTNVVVPAGNRPLRIDLAWRRATNTQANFEAAIFRSDTNNSGPKDAAWQMGTSNRDENAGGGVFWGIIRSGLAAGTYHWSFQITAQDGTSTIVGTTVNPVTIMVTEL